MGVDAPRDIKADYGQAVWDADSLQNAATLRALFRQHLPLTLVAVATVLVAACALLWLFGKGHAFHATCVLMTGLLIAYLQVQVRDLVANGDLRSLASPQYKQTFMRYIFYQNGKSGR
jgi:hypothetical protein